MLLKMLAMIAKYYVKGENVKAKKKKDIRMRISVLKNMNLGCKSSVLWLGWVGGEGEGIKVPFLISNKNSDPPYKMDLDLKQKSLRT